MNALPLSRVIWFTASATPEFGVSKIASTLSTSYHWRAIAEPTSGLFWWSAEITSTFSPRFWTPESSTAIRAASTEPAPERSEYRLDMSVSTPIFTTPSDTCACAPVARSAATTAAAAFLSNITLLLRFDCNSYAEILVHLAHVPFELGIGNHVHHPAVLHDVVAVGHRRGEAEILLDEQDGEPLRLQPPDRVADLLHDHRREAFGRFVEHQEPRPGAEDPPDRKHLLLAAGELRALAGEALLQVGE